MIGGVTPIDFSEIGFPIFPNLAIPMPRDLGYTALTAAEKAVDDEICTGVASCETCHGDPDGAAGPLPAPADGALVYDLVETEWTASRRSCGSCHDDLVWSLSYVQNTPGGMPPQPNDSSCFLCHTVSGPSAGGSVMDSHRHPVYDPVFNAGLNVAISAVAEAGTSDGDGAIDPGEKIAVTFTMTDDAGASVAASVAGSSLSVAMSGPSANRNLLLSGSIPTALLTGAQPFTINLPGPVAYELVGTSSGSLGDVFATSRAPHWNVTGAATSVLVRTGGGAGSVLAAGAASPQNFVDVAEGSAFVRDNYVVLDDGTAVEEYSRVTFVEGNRVWLGSLRYAHAAGAAVSVVTMAAKAAGTDYTLAAATGTITELTELGSGNDVVVSYTSDYVMPATYGAPINDSPDLDASWGEWAGLPVVSGTYSVGIWGARALTLTLLGESNSYRGTAKAAPADFLVGSATAIEPYALIDDPENCNSCHGDVMFHGGGRRGFETCALCHGSAGGEDRARYTAANAPATTGVTINFRTMLHKIHMGKELYDPASYVVVGFGAGAYPNNFTGHTYERVGFPPFPGGAKTCSKCHGESDAWESPGDRSHPTAGAPARAWRAACGSCHDAPASAAHMDINTSAGGVESCNVCHDADREFAVPTMHKVR